MEGARSFLESSTIHGLVYISTTKNKFVKICWILVVIGGFTGAGVMIYNSFKSWADSPVKTTIETLPITEITFPKVTVCPPKNTYTDLNYDLMMTENMTLDYDTRNELANYAMNMFIDDYVYDKVIRNMSKLEENNRYYHWYHGYTKITNAYYDSYGVNLAVATATSSGSVSTQQFGKEFDAAKVEAHSSYIVDISPPDSARNNPNVTLHLDIEKVSLTDLSSGEDTLILAYMGTTVEKSHTIFNITPIYVSSYMVRLFRNVLSSDMRKQKMRQMPGFKLSWHYSGTEVKSQAKYANDARNKAFVRNVAPSVNSIKILFHN